MTRSSPIVAYAREHGRRTCEILVLEDSKGFDELAGMIEDRLDGFVLERRDGPEARCWVIQVRGCLVELQHDDAWGNRLVSTSEAADAEVDRIGAAFERLLSTYA